MKKLVLLLGIVLIGFSAYSQTRTNEIKSTGSLEITIDGTTSHTFTDGKYETDTMNSTEATITNLNATDIDYNGSDISTVFSPAGEGVTNGNSHTHSEGDGAVIDHIDLTNIGSNTHSQIDAHISDASNPHSTILTQTYLRVTENVFTSSGSITNTSTTVILDTYEEDNSMWILAFTGEHNPYSSTFHGFNAYLICRVRNTYTSSWEPRVLKLGEESFSSRVVVDTNGDDVRLQSSQADATYPLYWILLKIR